jgi:hypothetical protein
VLTGRLVARDGGLVCCVPPLADERRERDEMEKKIRR